MKNKQKIVLLSLLSLLMAGCGQNPGSHPSSPASDKEPVSENVPVVSETPKPSESPSVSESPSDTSGTESVSTSPSTSAEKSPWNTVTTNLRKTYFDGFVIPYLDIGSGYDAEWHDATYKSSTYLEIYGNTFDFSKLAEFKTTYEGAGWTTTKETSTNITFTKDAYKVEVSKDSSGSFLVKAYYDVVFDAAKAPGAYDGDTLTEINDDFNGLTLPYIYLGAPVNYTTYASSTRTLTIYGYKYDEAIFSLAKTVFNADQWTIEEGTNNYGPTLTAVKEFADGQILTAKLVAPSPTATTRFSMTVALSEKWDTDAITDWEADLKTDFDLSCDHHVPTFFYLGTKTISWSWSDLYKRYTITGGVYDARTIPSVKQTLTAAGWMVNDRVGSYGDGISATRIFDDGCGFNVRIEPPQLATSKRTAYIYYIPKLPTSATSEWSDVITGFRTQKFGQTIPYVYIGEGALNATYDNSHTKRTIQTQQTGTFTSSKIVLDAEDIFEKAGYTVTVSYGSYGDDRTATKKFDNGDEFIVTLKSVSSSSRCSLVVQWVEAYDATYTGSWDTDRSYDNLTGTDTSSTAYNRKTYLDGHTIPYVYLGSKHHSSSWASTSQALNVYGGLWNTNILPSAKAAFLADDANKAEGDSEWTMTFDNLEDVSLATKFTAEKTFADGCSVRIVINKPTTPSASTPVTATNRVINYQDSWGAKATDWSSTVKAKRISSGFPSDDLIPYVYLGTDNPSVTGSRSTSTGSKKYQRYVDRAGTIYDPRVLTEFDTARTNAGWIMAPETIRSQQPAHEAYKYLYDDEGNITGILRACVYKSGTAATAKSNLNVYYDPISEVTTGTAVQWTDADKALRKEHLGGDEGVLPEFFIGTKSTCTWSSSSGGYLEVKTTALPYNYFNRITRKNTLITEGWDVTLALFSSTGNPNYYAYVTATKKTSSGTITRIIKNSSYTGVLIQAHYNETFQAPTGDQAGWTNATATALETKRGGYKLPYIYLGAADPLLTQSTTNKVATLKGSTWDDSIVTGFKTALANDSQVQYTFYEDYSGRLTYGITYVATGKYDVKIPAVYDDDGETIITPEKTVTHYITLKLYKDSDANWNRPILEVYYS